MPRGETRGSMEAERVALLTEVKKKKTFFKVTDLIQIFYRVYTTDNCTSDLQIPCTVELDRQTDRLIKVFNAKGGAAGRKITAIMALMDNVSFLFCFFI